MSSICIIHLHMNRMLMLQPTYKIKLGTCEYSECSSLWDLQNQSVSDLLNFTAYR